MPLEWINEVRLGASGSTIPGTPTLGDAELEENFYALLSTLVVVVESEENLPADATIRGMDFFDLSSVHEYLARGGMVHGNLGIDAEAVGWVYATTTVTLSGRLGITLWVRESSQ